MKNNWGSGVAPAVGRSWRKCTPLRHAAALCRIFVHVPALLSQVNAGIDLTLLILQVIINTPPEMTLTRKQTHRELARSGHGIDEMRNSKCTYNCCSLISAGPSMTKNKQQHGMSSITPRTQQGRSGIRLFRNRNSRPGLVQQYVWNIESASGANARHGFLLHLKRHGDSCRKNDCRRQRSECGFKAYPYQNTHLSPSPVGAPSWYRWR